LRYLLDVNFLIALLIASHVHNKRAHDWWRENMRAGWASCPITENGFVRIVSQPSFAAPLSVAEAISVLNNAKEDSDHEFWPDDVSITDDGKSIPSMLLKSDAITDAYLLALAINRNSRLVTLDRSIPIAAVYGAAKDHVFLAD
jgi:uncharacterized protein